MKFTPNKCRQALSLRLIPEAYATLGALLARKQLWSRPGLVPPPKTRFRPKVDAFVPEPPKVNLRKDGQHASSFYYSEA